MQNQEPKTEGQSVRTKALDQAQPDPGPKVKGEGNNPSDADDSDSLNPTRSQRGGGSQAAGVGRQQVQFLRGVRARL